MPQVRDDKDKRQLVADLVIHKRITNLLPSPKAKAFFETSIMQAFAKTPKLYQCTKGSIATALTCALQLNLDCSGVTGQAYLVPYNSKDGMLCQFMPGYQGLTAIMYRGKQIINIRTVRAHKEDEYMWDDDAGMEVPRLKPWPSLEERGAFLGIYSVATHVSGKKFWHYMSKEDLDKTKASSKASRSGPWIDWEEEMQAKTVIKRHIKLLPHETAEIDRAIVLDNQFEAGYTQSADFMDVDAEPVQEEAPPKTTDKEALLKEVGDLGAKVGTEAFDKTQHDLKLPSAISKATTDQLTSFRDALKLEAGLV